jgi:TonB family protein
MPCSPTPAAIISRAQVTYPDAARAEHLEGTALIKVRLDADAKVTGATVSKSAGSAVLDDAAVAAAKSSTYKAAQDESCKPLPSVAVIIVEVKP